MLKIILSRKGFDSAAGGYANPILPDGTLLSLPIPDESSPVQYSDLTWEGKSYYEIMCDLHGNKVKQDGISIKLNEATGCHLDPDIRFGAVDRLPGWKGIFGQIGAAQSHLSNHSVGVGDLFLYFGWFRKTVMENGKMKFDSKDRHGRHIIYGYMQVGDKVLANEDAEFSIWMMNHPHTAGERLIRKGNTVYIARDELDFVPEAPGYGVFAYDDSLVLTKPGENRSRWALPECFKGATMSYHSEKSWKDGYFQSAARGQEFVIQENEAVLSWAKALFK